MAERTRGVESLVLINLAREIALHVQAVPFVSPAFDFLNGT